jgi:hypothetical protein
MPPRWLCGFIVLFWLTMMGWFFWHDLRPRWLPDEPPLFHVDLVDEVHRNSSSLKILWIVERRKETEAAFYPVFHAETWVEYDPDAEEYTLNACLDAARDPKLQPVELAKFFKIDRLTSAYRVNGSGQLRSLEAQATVQVRWHWGLSPLGDLFREQLSAIQNSSSSDRILLSIKGEVRDQQFFAHCRAEAKSLSKPMQLDLPPTPVSYTGSVWMPLHPLSHIRGLRLGQSWRQPLVDPLHDALASLTGFSSGVRWLHARVLPQLELLEWGDDKTGCLVIEYTNEENELLGRTWVEQDGERVLQQEAALEDSRWIMRRELWRKGRNRLLDPRHD